MIAPASGETPSPESHVLDRFRLDGRVAVVTGASSGLGAGFAVALAQAGADLILGARRIDRLDKVRTEIEKLGRRALVVSTDVGDPTQCNSLVDVGMEHFGRIDVLINNAGLGSAVPALRESPEEFRRVVDINLFGAYYMAQACARSMLAGSSIVNVASVLALVGSTSPQAAYTASKAGLVGLTRDLSNQWSGRYGIRVNALAPGYVATDMTNELGKKELQEMVEKRATLGRLGEQHELDTAVVFLASPASSYMTGATLSVDGGISAN
jgi:NAD(P)-dependent dehydrogenase (short-subunit alcohol dehydrogenase family)